MAKFEFSDSSFICGNWLFVQPSLHFHFYSKLLHPSLLIGSLFLYNAKDLLGMCRKRVISSCSLTPEETIATGLYTSHCLLKITVNFIIPRFENFSCRKTVHFKNVCRCQTCIHLKNSFVPISHPYYIFPLHR